MPLLPGETKEDVFGEEFEDEEEVGKEEIEEEKGEGEEGSDDEEGADGEAAGEDGEEGDQAAPEEGDGAVPPDGDGEDGSGEPGADDNGSTAPNSFTVNIDGKKAEVGREELIRGYQTWQSAQHRYDEAADMRKGAETFYQSLVDKPMDTLLRVFSQYTDGDHNKAYDLVRGHTEQFMAGVIEEAALTPEQQDGLRAKRDYEAKAATAEKVTKKAQFDAVTADRQRRAQAAVPILAVIADKYKIQNGSPEHMQIDQDFATRVMRGETITVAVAEAAAKEASNRRNGFKESALASVTAEELDKNYPQLVKELRKLDVKRTKKHIATKGGKQAKIPDGSSPAKPRRGEAQSPVYYNSIEEMVRASKKKAGHSS